MKEKGVIVTQSIDIMNIIDSEDFMSEENTGGRTQTELIDVTFIVTFIAKSEEIITERKGNTIGETGEKIEERGKSIAHIAPNMLGAREEINGNRAEEGESVNGKEKRIIIAVMKIGASNNKSIQKQATQILRINHKNKIFWRNK